MCGICGIVHANGKGKVSQETLRRMCKIMRHRGPDDEGYFVKNGIGFGHHRLSVIDLETGHQPMSNEEESIWIVYNGEIYNYLELREELIDNGYKFRTASDTEVIIHLYEKFGDECVRHLNGMFAFAIWDDKRNKLFLARDRLGIKPLYYFSDGKQMLFASEIKAIIQNEDVIVEPEYTAIMDYMTLQYVLGEKTFFRNIKKLMPGHTLSFESGKIKIKEYWDLKFNIDHAHDESYFTEKLYDLLLDSVRLQLRSDVPLGCHLSGGLDSSSVTCLAASLLKHPVKTFSGAFAGGSEYDETPYAKIVAKHANTEYFEIFPESGDFLQLLSKLIWYLDEPVVGPGIIPQYHVSKLASENVKVVLGGQGGDENFVGYGRYMQFYFEQVVTDIFRKTGKFAHANKIGKIAMLKGIIALGMKPLLSSLLRLRPMEPSKRYFKIVRLLSRKMIENVLNDDFYQKTNDYNTFETFKEYFNRSNASNYLDMAQYYDIKAYLPGLLQVEDRTSMAVSLESRVPILDHRIVEFVATIPTEIKIRDFTPKYVFKNAMRRVLPEEIYARTDKMGFPTPISIWLREHNEDIRNILINQRVQSRGIFNVNFLEKLLDEHVTGHRDHSKLIWVVLCIENWFKIFVDKDSAPDLS